MTAFDDDPESEDEKRVRAAEWVRTLVRYLDTAVTIPGTDVSIGLDPIIGFFFPAVGDWVGAIASLVLFSEAFKRRVPPVIMLRMLLNVAIDTFVGMIPVLGDVFDVAFRSNQRNLELLERHAREGQPRARDYVVVTFAVVVVLVLAALPLVLIAALIRWIASS